MKTLAVCIPTYKRPELLRRCILSAIKSAGDCPIQIIVADDSVTDTNAGVLGELCATYSFVHWHRNSKNLGIDENIQHVVELCEHDYAWLIGEDDVFLANAVADMYRRLQTINAPFVFANYAFVDEDPNCILGQVFPNSPDAPMARDLFLAQHLWAVGFLGGCVIQRKAWGRTDPRPYFGTYYTHVGRIVEMLADATSVYVAGQCCVANRVEGEDTFTWKKDSYGVFFGFLAMCNIAGGRIPKLADKMVKAAAGFERRYKWLSFRLAARLRSEHAFDYFQFRKYLFRADINSLKKMILLIISIAPPAMFRPIVSVYRSFRR